MGPAWAGRGWRCRTNVVPYPVYATGPCFVPYASHCNSYEVIVLHEDDCCSPTTYKSYSQSRPSQSQYLQPKIAESQPQANDASQPDPTSTESIVTAPESTPELSTIVESVPELEPIEEKMVATTSAEAPVEPTSEPTSEPSITSPPVEKNIFEEEDFASASRDTLKPTPQENTIPDSQKESPQPLPEQNDSKPTSDNPTESIEDPFSGSEDPFSLLPPEPVRRWVDTSGHYETVGQLVEVHPDCVRIIKLNGRYTTVALDRLSVIDQQYIATIENHLATVAKLSETAGR